MGRILKCIISLTFILTLALPASAAGPCNKAVVVYLDVSLSNVQAKNLVPDYYGSSQQTSLLQHTIWSLNEALFGEGSDLLDKGDYLSVYGFSSAAFQMVKVPSYTPGADNNAIRQVFSIIDSNGDRSLNINDFTDQKNNSFFEQKLVARKGLTRKVLQKRKTTNFEKVIESIESTVGAIKLGSDSRFYGLIILVVSDGFHDDTSNTAKYKSALIKASGAVSLARRKGPVTIALLKVGKGEKSNSDKPVDDDLVSYLDAKVGSLSSETTNQLKAEITPSITASIDYEIPGQPQWDSSRNAYLVPLRFTNRSCQTVVVDKIWFSIRKKQSASGTSLLEGEFSPENLTLPGATEEKNITDTFILVKIPTPWPTFLDYELVLRPVINGNRDDDRAASVSVPHPPIPLLYSVLLIAAILLMPVFLYAYFKQRRFRISINLTRRQNRLNNRTDPTGNPDSEDWESRSSKSQ